MTARRTTDWFGRAILLGLTTILLAAQTTYAQRRLRQEQGYSQSSARRYGPVSKVEKMDLKAPSGVCQGRIYKFEPTDDDEDSIGTLKIRPNPPESRTLKLEVTDDDNVRVSLAGHHFDPLEYPEILSKGFFCSVRWGTQQSEDEQTKKKAPKLLRSLELETLVVQGRIDEIGDDYLVLVRARPQDGRQWPDVAAYLARTSRTSDSQKTSRPARKKLELGFVEPVTSFADAKGSPLYMSDFTEGEDVEAVIAYGGKRGLLIELRSLVSYDGPADNDIAGASERPNAPSHRLRGIPRS